MKGDKGKTDPSIGVEQKSAHVSLTEFAGRLLGFDDYVSKYFR